MSNALTHQKQFIVKADKTNMSLTATPTLIIGNEYVVCDSLTSLMLTVHLHTHSAHSFQSSIRSSVCQWKLLELTNSNFGSLCGTFQVICAF